MLFVRCFPDATTGTKGYNTPTTKNTQEDIARPGATPSALYLLGFPAKGIYLFLSTLFANEVGGAET